MLIGNSRREFVHVFLLWALRRRQKGQFRRNDEAEMVENNGRVTDTEPSSRSKPNETTIAEETTVDKDTMFGTLGGASAIKVEKSDPTQTKYVSHISHLTDPKFDALRMITPDMKSLRIATPEMRDLRMTTPMTTTRRPSPIEEEPAEASMMEYVIEEELDVGPTTPELVTRTPVSSD